MTFYQGYYISVSMEANIVSLFQISETKSFSWWLVNLCWLADLVWQWLSQNTWGPIFLVLPFGRTLESSLSVTQGTGPLLNLGICPNIFAHLCPNIFAHQCPNIFVHQCINVQSSMSSQSVNIYPSMPSVPSVILKMRTICYIMENADNLLKSGKCKHFAKVRKMRTIC